MIARSGSILIDHAMHETAQRNRQLPGAREREDRADRRAVPPPHPASSVPVIRRAALGSDAAQLTAGRREQRPHAHLGRESARPRRSPRRCARPSRSRSRWTTRSIALAACWRTATCGSATSAISASVSMRRSASAAGVRVHGGHRSVVSRVQRLQHVERLRAAHLADDDAIGAHAQRVAHELADRHLSPTLEVRGTALEAQDVRLLEPQLGRVLDRDHALARRRCTTTARSSKVVLPEPVPPLTTTLRRCNDALAQKVERVLRQRAVLDQLVRREPASAKPPDREQRTVQAQRRDHAVDPRAVGQAGVRERRCLVDPPAEWAQDPLDHVQERLLRLERRARRLDAAAALDQHRPVAR